jgi:hypothetical protein
MKGAANGVIRKQKAGAILWRFNENLVMRLQQFTKLAAK